jgi:hypothetical protein
MCLTLICHRTFRSQLNYFKPSEPNRKSICSRSVETQFLFCCAVPGLDTPSPPLHMADFLYPTPSSFKVHCLFTVHPETSWQKVHRRHIPFGIRNIWNLCILLSHIIDNWAAFRIPGWRFTSWIMEEFWLIVLQYTYFCWKVRCFKFLDPFTCKLVFLQW